MMVSFPVIMKASKSIGDRKQGIMIEPPMNKGL